ncbi:MAG: NUDIX domain-containing protein [Candidatus Wallbacteria bacterium]|nr:NUDIX domain-containing protein [Candidatus Wallbacteria bacterium]
MKNLRIRVGLLLFQNEAVLLVKHRKTDREYWLPPGGGVEFGETLCAALKREVLEECSVVIEPGDLAFTCETIGGEGRHIVHMFFHGRLVSGTPAPGQEHILADVRFVPLCELSTITVYPRVTDKIIMLAKTKAVTPFHISGNLWED